MIRLLPRGLTGQTVLVLLIGLTVSHVLSMWLYSGERREVLARLGSHDLGVRIGEMARLFDETPPEWRDHLARVTDSAALRVTITDRSVVDDGPPGDPHHQAVRETVGSFLRDPHRSVHVRSGDPPVPSRRFGLSYAGPDSLVIGVALHDGGWVNFSALLPDAAPLWSSHAVLSIVLMALGVVGASVWVVWRLTRPLKMFAEAADRLGKDVGSPALPVSGPLEVRQAATAFNEMQDRIRRLVENRTRMLAAISHDLRTPITLLRLRAEFVEDDEERGKMLATLDEMEHLIAATLSFARDDAVQEERRTVDIAALLATVCDEFTDAGADVSLDADARLPLGCRPKTLKRALVNLIDNAVKYGGRVRVRLEADARVARIHVEDDGPGIPEDEQARVLQPFYRIEKSRSRETGGVGLGLAVASGIVHAHGGELTLANRAQGGLHVTVELPR
jgi:signal transduction histidine kinase